MSPLRERIAMAIDSVLAGTLPEDATDALHDAIEQEMKDLFDLCSSACGVIAGVNSGDWSKQSPGWRVNAAEWRTRWEQSLQSLRGRVAAYGRSAEEGRTPD